MENTFHPLDPLSPEEIQRSSTIIKESRPNIPWIFNSMILIEPPKSELFPLLQQESPNFTSLPRKSFVIVIDPEARSAYEVVVDLKQEDIERFDQLDSPAKPPVSEKDVTTSIRVLKEDPQVIQRVQQLGLDVQNIVALPWPIGYYGQEDDIYDGKRVVQMHIYFTKEPGDNFYAHPLDFIAYVDILAEKVLSLQNLPLGNGSEANQTTYELPNKSSNYLSKFKDDDYFRADIKPYEIVQPEGSSFTVNGNEIYWQKWRFRISFNYRTGVVLHNITYNDKEGKRLLFYRISISEMIVVYADPRNPYYRNIGFDAGEYGIGSGANELMKGCDTISDTYFFDAYLCGSNGEPKLYKNAACIYEEDCGLLQKHTDYRTEVKYMARARKLVLKMTTTLGNYDYGILWEFFEDGTIENKILLTGQLSTYPILESVERPKYGSKVLPKVNAHYHSHFFCVRIDPMIEGQKNSVSMFDIESLKIGKNNPAGNGWKLNETKFETSQQAVSDGKPEVTRFWTIYNPSAGDNVITETPKAWKLMPPAPMLLLSKEDSILRRRLAFASHSLWVTPFRDDELYPAGKYLHQSKGEDGVEIWTNRNESISNKDIVLWHTYGLHHILRPEDFPIMPAEFVGFSLRPYNFFTANPALDVVPSCDDTRN